MKTLFGIMVLGVMVAGCEPDEKQTINPVCETDEDCYLFMPYQESYCKTYFANSTDLPSFYVVDPGEWICHKTGVCVPGKIILEECDPDERCVYGSKDDVYCEYWEGRQ